jgi:ankyrin repeat protein
MRRCFRVVRMRKSSSINVLSMKFDLFRGLLHAAFYYQHADIARLLMSKQADADNINDDNVAPLFHLFQPRPSRICPAAQELLDIAFLYSAPDINLQSYEGWTVLHRAAAYGTGDDVHALINRGASTVLKTGEYGWSPLATAVRFRNVATFDRLLKHVGVEAIRETDSRGWTMLHLAAEQGNRQLITRLVTSGAELHAMSEVRAVSVSRNSQACKMTPIDVARSLGPQKLQEYVHGLQHANIDIHMDSDEVFWLAEE